MIDKQALFCSYTKLIICSALVQSIIIVPSLYISFEDHDEVCGMCLGKMCLDIWLEVFSYEKIISMALLFLTSPFLLIDGHVLVFPATLMVMDYVFNLGWFILGIIFLSIQSQECVMNDALGIITLVNLFFIIIWFIPLKTILILYEKYIK
jgi:hypothetical protein